MSLFILLPTPAAIAGAQVMRSVVSVGLLVCLFVRALKEKRPEQLSTPKSVEIQGGAEYIGLFTFVLKVLYFYNKTRKYDNVRVAPRTLVKVVLDVSSTGCKNERQSFAKLSYSAINNIFTNLFPVL